MSQSFLRKPLLILAEQKPFDFQVETASGTMRGSAGDFLLTGISGEKYLCKESVFPLLYVPEDSLSWIAKILLKLLNRIF
jgi:hypothetical protein